jgi:hypothetical protein
MHLFVDKLRIPKSLRTSHPLGATPVLHENEDEKDEAEFIAKEIKRCDANMGGVIRWGDFAVLRNPLANTPKILANILKLLEGDSQATHKYSQATRKYFQLLASNSQVTRSFTSAQKELLNQKKKLVRILTPPLNTLSPPFQTSSFSSFIS